MDDLDDKTGSEWLYIDSLKKNISDMQKDLKALRNDLDDLSDPVGSISSDVVSAISNVQDVLKDLKATASFPMTAITVLTAHWTP